MLHDTTLVFVNTTLYKRKKIGKRKKNSKNFVKKNVYEENRTHALVDMKANGVLHRTASMEYSEHRL